MIRKLSHAQQKQSVILGALEQSNLFGPSNKVLYLKKLVIKSGVGFLILFVLVDAILQKVVYFKNESGTGVVFLPASHFGHEIFGPRTLWPILFGQYLTLANLNWAVNIWASLLLAMHTLADDTLDFLIRA